MPEQILIDHCSPTLAGLKTANMFQVTLEKGQDIRDELRALNRLLREKGVRLIILRKSDKKALIYLYRPDYLVRDLGCPEAKKILEGKGYHCRNAGHCIAELVRRMGKQDFPHEVGLFLGYPLDDVRCFMEDPRKGVKCEGFWKVYGNEEEAKEVFLRYKKCTDAYRRQLSKGKSLFQLTVRTNLHS